MGNAVSAFGRTLDDTIARVEAISPRVDPGQRFTYLGSTRSVTLTGTSGRQFAVSSAPSQEARIVGCGQRQDRRVITLTTYYLPSDDVDDRVAGDHQDLVNALEPGATYPSGSWGACKVRKVLDPTETRDEATGRVTVARGVEVTYRYPYSV